MEIVAMYFRENKHLSLTTQKNYTRILYRFADSVPANAHAFCVENVENFIFAESKRLKPTSLNFIINCLKSFCSWLTAETGCRNMGRKIRTITTLLPARRLITRAEYDIICARITGNDLATFKFLCNTGLRASEFLSLTSENINNDFLQVIGKGRRRRSIPLNKTTREIVECWPNFEFFQGKSLSILSHTFRRIVRNAGVPSFHPHSCRHYFANELYHRGVDMSTISRLLGHRDSKTTETVYVHWTEETLKGSTDLLE